MGEALTLAKVGSLLRNEVGWDWVGSCAEIETVGTDFRPETSISIGMGDSWWEELCLYF